jgi:phosphohistidine phosphatase SixA
MTKEPWVWTGIMRHGQAFRPADNRARQSSLTKAGLADAAAVARRLAETLSEDGIDPRKVAVVCAPSAEARDTATALTKGLGAAGVIVELPALDPSTWTHRSSEEPADRWQKIHKEILKLNNGKRAFVIVGHDPQVSWLLHHLVDLGGGGQRSAGPMPLGRGELAMLAGPPGKPRLRYVISPSDQKLIEELQAKIKSKMDSAKLLGAFLTALLVFAARELASAEDPPSWHPWLGGLGLVLLAMATAAYFVTMFRYDELLMPVRMWPSPRGSDSSLPRGFAVRPPTSASWILYQNMMRVWSNAFVPGTVLGGCGSIAVTVALARPQDRWWLAVGVSIAAVLGVTWLVWHVARPNLGVSD